MNDPTDYVFARDIVLPQLTQKMSDEEKDDCLNIYPYIISFCKERDDDMMWRLYHGEIALVIDGDKFPVDEWAKPGNISANVLHQNVAYATPETINEAAQSLYDDRIAILKDGKVDEYQLYVLPFIKNEAYKVEHEYRLVKIDYDSVIAKYEPDNPEKCVLYDGEIPNGIKCLVGKDGQLRLYKEFQLPKECLVGIILHTFDEAHFKMQKKHMELWLRQNGFRFENIKIERTSAYPIR